MLNGDFPLHWVSMRRWLDCRCLRALQARLCPNRQSLYTYSLRYMIPDLVHLEHPSKMEDPGQAQNGCHSNPNKTEQDDARVFGYVC